MRLMVPGLALLLAWPGLALAQGDPMEAQRCVWRCLANARGADDPAYHACVQRQCNEAPARPAARPPAGRQAWRSLPGTRYPAVGICQGENLCFMVSCPVRREISVELYAVEHGWVAGLPVRLHTSLGTFQQALPERPAGSDTYRWPLTPELYQALNNDAVLVLEIDGSSFQLPLAGSSAAIRGLLDRCR